jgi:hypothetical protein
VCIGAGVKGAAARCPLNATCFPTPTTRQSRRGDVKTQAGRLYLNSTEGCPDEVKRLAKGRSAGSGRQRFLNRWEAGSSVSVKRIEARDPLFCEALRSTKTRFALDSIDKPELCSRQIDFHTCTDDTDKIVIRSQLLLSLILPLLLIGVGLIGFGKRTGLATM